MSPKVGGGSGIWCGLTLRLWRPEAGASRPMAEAALATASINVRKPVILRHAYQSAPKNPAMSAANSSGASAAAKWPPRGMGVQRWMS